MGKPLQAKKGIFDFPALFWLVVVFEFFERGSYYGMMSILSVYMTEQLHFAKESVGLIKGTIQPLLYFLPIISGALADRFGYRRMLMIAFSLLGLGYFLTSQATDYALVFGALVVMGFGAGTFKPIISGTIARVTDEKNSTVGFGIFYWSINLGAFLFPLILVPILKKMDWSYVIIASAICTAALLIPTFFLYKDPVKSTSHNQQKPINLIQTLANAFEIIYSPVVLLYQLMKKTVVKRTIILLVLGLLFVYSLINYLQTPKVSEKYATIGIPFQKTILLFKVERNMLAPGDFQLKSLTLDSSRIALTIYKPDRIENYSSVLLDSLQRYPDLAGITKNDLNDFIRISDQKVELLLERTSGGNEDYKIIQEADNRFKVILYRTESFNQYQQNLQAQLNTYPILAGITTEQVKKLYDASDSRSFFLLYVTALFLIALAIISYSQNRNQKSHSVNYTLSFFIVTAVGLILWFLPGLSVLGRVISYIIFITVTALFIIDKSDTAKFKDHAKFLLMIFLYSGFWILYFQMFDSVLWYVQAYVDGTSINLAVNKFLGLFAIQLNWFFDIEHVTVINAGTIILLQLLISNIVKTKKALPTMISGIGIATLGMAILAISSNIWVFIAGIIMFSIGEMTAHPKFISYVGLIAPADRKAMYMGYLFLYGVFGSSIGGIMGARMYVHFVDNLNQPKTLWLIFSCIGMLTIVALLLYNKFLGTREVKKN
jgi:dipeptide/tripeptide permease